MPSDPHSTPPNWTLADAPEQTGKVAIVTGGNGGIGYETALGLARLGADTIIATRNRTRGEQAAARIRTELPAATIRFEPLDLGSLASIASFADRLGALPVNILVNNAGVMGLTKRQTTTDGFERQIGVNYLGHFALTARLKHALCAGQARVVQVASLAHRRATLNLDDLQAERSYNPMRAYGQTKLAMLVFALELERRARTNGWTLTSIAAHPGWARTDIIGNGIGGGATSLKTLIIGTAFGLLAQSAKAGALPSLYAATAPQARGGGYYGPSGPGEHRGAPGQSRIFPQALDQAAAARLWTLSEKLTGASFS